MAFASCVRCHSWTFPKNAKHPPPSLPSKSQKITIYTPQHRHNKELASISASSSPSLSPSQQLPPDFTPKQLLNVIRREKNETSALRLFNWASKQPNFKPTLSIYEEVLRKLGEVGSFHSMRQILEDMKISQCEPEESTFLIFILYYAKFHWHTEAIGVLDVMEKEYGLRPFTSTYNFLLVVLVDGNKLKLVESVRSMMFSRGVKSNNFTFDILIRAMCKAHQIRPAVLLMEDMPKYGLVPDEKTLTTIMQGYIEQGHLEGALRIREKMIAAQCPSSIVSVNVLIEGYCKVGRIEDALSFAEKMFLQGFSPDKFTFNTLVNGLCKSGYVKYAMEMVDLMLEAGFDPNIFTYNILISGLCKSGEVEEAVEVLNLMLSRDCYPDTVTYTTLVTTFCREGDLEKAADIVLGMKSNGCEPTVVTYGSLIQGLCKTGRIETASQLLRTLQMQGMSLTPLTYLPVIQALIRQKRTKEAIRLFREMEEKCHPSDSWSYNATLRGLCYGGGPIGEAVNFVVEMTDKGFLPDSSSFSILAKVLCALSMEDTLINVVERIIEKANFSNNKASMIMGLLKMRKFQDALGILCNSLNSRKQKIGFK